MTGYAITINANGTTGWRAVGSEADLLSGETFATEPPAPTLTETKYSLCAGIDASADATYIAIGGPSPGRLAEYQQAKADAIAFKDAGYTGTAPSTVQSWATASGMTAQEATDNILATATQWAAALDYIRAQRLQGKANVNAASDAVAAQIAADSAIANIRAAATGL